MPSKTATAYKVSMTEQHEWVRIKVSEAATRA